MRICFICNEYPPSRYGGIGTATRTLARALVAAGHQVRVVGLSYHQENSLSFECDCGVEVWRLKASSARFSWIWARYTIFRTVQQWAKSKRIDLVEAPDYEGVVAGWPALPVPVIVRFHGSGSYFAVEMGRRPKRGTLFLEAASLRRANFYCSCSRYTADQTYRLFGLQIRDISILHNAVTVAADIPEKNRSANQVVFTGTLTPKKGVISLIHAWPLVVNSCPKAKLDIFGNDGRTDAGESMRDFLLSSLPASIRNTVHFRGHVEQADLRNALRAASVAVFPSYSEAFAMAPMEAMAEACPTIYSRRGSGAELIKDGETGLLVDPAEPGAIARAITNVLSDANLAARLGSAGREHIARCFSTSALLVKNVNFYQACVQSFRSTSFERAEAA